MLDVTCFACALTHVPLDVIAESQRLLDELGPCVGLASFECPVLYFAGLASPETLAELRAADAALDDHCELARWETDGGACSLQRA